jgi:hypothetical protein
VLLFLLSAPAVVFVLIYFIAQSRRHDEAWRNFRQGKRERRMYRPADELPDANFQFDNSPASGDIVDRLP